MRKGIILITKHFPFNKGETPAESYLENEIITLAKHTEKIFVIATEAKNGSSVTCELPQNVQAAALQTKDSKGIKMSCFAKSTGMFFSKKSSEITDEIKSRKLNTKQKAFLFYFKKRAEQKLFCVSKLIESKAINLNDYDAIYSFWLFDSAYMAVMLKEKYQLNNYVVVSRTHRYDLYEYNNKLKYIPLRPYLLEKLDGVFPCSDNGTKYLSERYPNFKNKIQTSFLGSKDYGVQNYKHIGNKLHIASCSRLISVKRVNRIVDALSKLEKEPFEVEWTHFGGGALFDELKNQVNTSLKKTKVNLMGNTENKEVMRQYSKMIVDVFVNVSENEGLPISIMEATSFGIPVIATDVGGTSEIVRQGENGFLLKKDYTDDELCELLCKFAYMSKEEYLPFRENSRKIYEENFECVHNIEQFLLKIGG